MGGMKMRVHSSARFFHAVVWLVAFAAVFVLASCSDALLNEMARLAADANRPSISPADGAIITAHETITLTFPKTMDPASVTIAGDIGTAGAEWSTTALTNDALTLNGYDTGSPVIAWTAGTGKTLTITVVSSGETIVYTYTFEVFRGVCVRQDGLDDNPGTAVKPKKNIKAGIDAVVDSQLYGAAGEVHVAAGTYPTDWAGSQNRITIVEGVSLLGGYASDWTARDIAANRTVIVDQSTTGGSTNNNPNRAIDVPSGITSATVIEGFAVYGSNSGTIGGNYTAAVFCGSSPSIRNNEIIAGGNGTNADYRYGIEIYTTGSASPTITLNNFNQGSLGGGSAILECDGVVINSDGNAVIEKNLISGGQADTTTGTANGIYINSSNANPRIDANTIDGGSASYTHGIGSNGLSISVSVKIYNNIVKSGLYSAGESYAIFLWSSAAIIRNNTIVIGNAGMLVGDAYGIYAYDNSVQTQNTMVENNILTFESSTASYYGYGIYENVAMTFASVKNNDFAHLLPSGSYLTLYFNDGTTRITTLAALNTLLSNTTNITDDPLLDSALVPTASSPIAVTAGGIDGAVSYGFTTDKNGTTRTGNGTTGWTMGCYEKD
jgi:hypothetical protein